MRERCCSTFGCSLLMASFPAGLAFIACGCMQGSEPSKLTGVCDRKEKEKLKVAGCRQGTRACWSVAWALCGRRKREAACCTATAQSHYSNPTLVPCCGVEFQIVQFGYINIALLDVHWSSRIPRVHALALAHAIPHGILMYVTYRFLPT